MLTFDSTMMIVRFNENVNRDVFISSTNTKELFKLEITNILGQNVLNQDQIITNSKIKIDVSTLPTGVFYLKITNTSGEKSVKRISIVR